MEITQILGWIGTVLIVSAYFLEEFKGDNTLCKFMNLFGAIFVGFNVFHQQAWPSFALQIVWGIIAVVSLFKKKKL